MQCKLIDSNSFCKRKFKIPELNGLSFVFSIAIGLVMLIPPGDLMGQKCSKTALLFIDKPPQFKIKVPKNLSLDSTLSVLKKQFYDSGYLNFSVDSISNNTDCCFLHIHSGVKFLLAKIELKPELFSSFSKQYVFKPNLSTKLLKQNDVKTLRFVQNQGFPFARLEKEIIFEKNRATITYYAHQGNLVRFDTLETSPPDLISYNYISKKTGIVAGEPYNIKALSNLNRNIIQSQFFTVDSVYSLISEYNAKIILKLKKVSQNTFSGIVGMQSNTDNETLITGNVSISLANAFKKGEKIQFEWQKPSNESQQLEANFSMPFIFKLPVGASLSGDFYKQDSSFLNTMLNVALLIPIINYGEFSVHAKMQTSSVTNESLAQLSSNNSNLYGVGYAYSMFDNPITPQKGIAFETQFYFGSNNSILKGENDVKTPMFEWVGDIKFAVPVPLGAFYVKNEWGLLLNDSIKLNNLYRLGGAKSIRGFNEKSIYSNAYSYANIEYHVHLNVRSYLYGFYDVGLFNESVSNKYTKIWRQSFGGGLSVDTKAGQLSISYAIGKYSSNPFQFNEGKIHVAYINRF